MNTHKNDKKARLNSALKLTKRYKGCEAIGCRSNGNNTWVEVWVLNTRLILDILEHQDYDIFRVHAAELLSARSPKDALMVANRANALLDVGNVIAFENKLAVFAHEFTSKGHIPSANILRLLIDDVLAAVLFVLQELKQLEPKLALSDALPVCRDPSQN
jgi:hypothetical protein